MIVWVVLVQTNWIRHADNSVASTVGKVSDDGTDNFLFLHNSVRERERESERTYLVFASCQSQTDRSAACDNPNLVSISFLLDKEVLVVMVGVAAIRPFFRSEPSW